MAGLIEIRALVSGGYGTNYYVKNGGNDLLDGLSDATAWETLTKVNATGFNPGDKVLFKRGNTWYGSLVALSNGDSSYPLTYGAYGSGNLPVISGFSTITGWTNEGGGIYSKTISCESSPKFITIDGTMYGKGRYPNVGTDLIYDSCTSNSITDADLDSAVTNWTGAQVVIRKNEYNTQVYTVTSHSSHTLNFTGSGEDPTANYYYFIQNDLKTLTYFGAWFYGGGKLSVYFGTDPSAYTVKMPVIDKTYYNIWRNYITLNGIYFEGANTHLVHFQETEYSTLKNCYLKYSGLFGAYMGLNSQTVVVHNNTIDTIGEMGIMCYRGGTITNNTIQNAGLIEGMCEDGGAWGVGIYLNSVINGITVQNNIIDYTGYNSIYLSGNDSVIKNNYLSHFCYNMNDGAGIYTDGDGYTGRVINGNIIINGLEKKGMTTSDPAVMGIYLDSYSAYISVINNLVSGVSRFAIMLSNAHDITVQYNTCYNNPYNMYILEWGGSNAVYNITMDHNIFFGRLATDLSFMFNSQAGSIGSFGTSNYNYFTRPIDDTNVIYTYEGGLPLDSFRTLSNWKTYSSQDANSVGALTTVDNVNKLHLLYNETAVNKSFTLSQAMVDVTNASYSGTVVLSPYTSLILIGAGTVS